MTFPTEAIVTALSTAGAMKMEVVLPPPIMRLQWAPDVILERQCENAVCRLHVVFMYNICLCISR